MIYTEFNMFEKKIIVTVINDISWAIPEGESFSALFLNAMLENPV